MTVVDGAPDAFETQAKRVDDASSAVHELADSESRDAALELGSAIEEFHRPALVSIVQTLKADPRGKELLFELVDDPSVRAVFALHGIIRADPLTRGNQALVSVRPYLQSHGGDVELVEVRGSTAVVRLHGSCNGCSMSSVTLREGVEAALIEGVDEITEIEVLEDEPTSAFIPLESLGRRDGRGWVPGPKVDEIPVGGMLRFDIVTDTDGEPASNESFVITNIDNRLGVFRNVCVHQGLTLDGGHIDEGKLVCPWHGFSFDATTGECLSAPGAQLEQVPMRIESGRLSIRANPGGD